MKLKKFLDISLIIIFLGLITSVLIFSDKAGGKPSAEGRYLASFPSIIHDGKILLSEVRSIDNWINDNAAGRQFFLKTAAKIDYYAFHLHTDPNTIIGKDNSFFFIGENGYIIPDYQRINLPDQNELTAIINLFKVFEEKLSQRNIPLVTILVPDKKTVYSELYPDSILRVNNISRSDMMVNAAEQVDLDFIYPMEELIKSKEIALTYEKRWDYTHWNEYGAFIGYLEIAKHIQRYFPDIMIYDLDKYTITSSEQQVSLMDAVHFTDLIYHFEPTGTSNNVAMNPEFFVDNSLFQNSIRPGFARRYVNSNKELPKILLIGDSYSEKLTPFLAQSASELTVVHILETDDLERVIDLAQPDIVIFEFVEREFDTGIYSMWKIASM